MLLHFLRPWWCDPDLISISVPTGAGCKGQGLRVELLGPQHPHLDPDKRVDLQPVGRVRVNCPCRHFFHLSFSIEQALCVCEVQDIFWKSNEVKKKSVPVPKKKKTK